MSLTDFDVREDVATPFEVEGLNVRGRSVRLSQTVNRVLRAHDYPTLVARLLGEALCLCALLGSSLKFDGRFILQVQGDGPVSLLVADFNTPGGLRGYARFDEERIKALNGAAQDLPALTGEGALVLTIDQGTNTSRYQGIVPLEGRSLADAAHTYFTQSEQIPTRVHLAVGEEQMRGEKGSHWRAAGFMIQHLPEGGSRVRDLPGGDDPQGDDEMASLSPADDDWAEAEALFSTLEDHEMLATDLASERLLFRLYHERGVRVFDPSPLEFSCHCSEEKIKNVLRQFNDEEIEEMVVDNEITVTCEFCNKTYPFSRSDVDALKAE